MANPNPNPNQVDKKALPSARAAILSADRSGRSVPFREAQTPTETGLIEIFGKLFLGADRAEATEQVGADDDFGDLGGNSLSAGRLVGVCRERFGVQIAMIDVFEKRTPAKIAKVVDELLLEQRDDLPTSPKGTNPNTLTLTLTLPLTLTLTLTLTLILTLTTLPMRLASCARFSSSQKIAGAPG